MTRWQDRAYHLRRWILGIGIILIADGLVVLFPMEFWYFPVGYVYTPLMVPELIDLREPSIYANNAIVIGVMLILQWFMLRPGRGWAVRAIQTGRPLKSSILAASFMCMLLTTGMIATLLELPNWWEEVFDSQITFYSLWAGMAIVWLLWAILFFCYWQQGDRYTWMGRLTRALIVGSIMEILLAAPIQVWATRHRSPDCYCARGSYTGLIFGTTVLFWAFGPGLVLLFMREHYRRAKLYAMICPACGYDLRGSIPAGSTTCPECGHPISHRQ